MKIRNRSADGCGVFRWVGLAVALLLVSRVNAAGTGATKWVWIAGAKPAGFSPATLKPKLQGWGRTKFLYGGHWLSYNLSPQQSQQVVPLRGLRIRYNFKCPAAENYQVWMRIGFEFARAPFSWRVDRGPWHRVSPNAPTVDMMTLTTWCQVSWLHVGKVHVAAGRHTFEVRLLPYATYHGRGPVPTRQAIRAAIEANRRAPKLPLQWQRVLFGCNAICLYAGHFSPNGPYAPGTWKPSKLDQEAAATVYRLPAAAGGAVRTSISLAGLWQICRDGQLLPTRAGVPIGHLPQHPLWTAIAVPGNKNVERPDLRYCHRLWYRCRVLVPESYAGDGFHLVFPLNNLNTTVFVNGKYCGFCNAPYARFRMDISRAMHPGINEIWVGIRDAWYGYVNDPKNPLVLKQEFSYPMALLSRGFQNLVYPIWNRSASGILVRPRLVATGAVYASNVFVKPNVQQHLLDVQVKVRNTTTQAQTGEVICEALSPRTGRIAKKLPAEHFQVAAGAVEKLQVSGSWVHPILWWPNAPHLYTLRTLVMLNGHRADVKNTTFGFRQWTADGINFELNGVVFHGWCDQHGGSSARQWLASQKKKHETMMRFWVGRRWLGMAPQQALDFLDRHGVVVRDQGILDGEVIGYEPHMALAKHWRQQVVAWIRGYRNHPAIMVWSLENEFMYVNINNLNQVARWTPVETRVSEAALKVDPTRFTMSDGGGATTEETLPICGNHYITGPWSAYPPLAYQANVNGGGRGGSHWVWHPVNHPHFTRGAWVWDKKRPRFIGEDYFINGSHPGLAVIGGPGVFSSNRIMHQAAGKLETILQQGYRWDQYGAWDFWTGAAYTGNRVYKSMAPRAVFCKNWNWTFGSGRAVPRRMGIFNDTHSDAPITLAWTWAVAGHDIARASSVYAVPAGTSKKFTMVLQMPRETTRTNGTWHLKLLVANRVVYQDTKHISILPTGDTQPKMTGVAALTAANFGVWDPHHKLTAFLRDHHIGFTPVKTLSTLPGGLQVLLVGPNALSARQSGSSRLAAWALSGRRVIVLEQKHPLVYESTPANLRTAENICYTGFGMNFSGRVLRGLRQKDFFTWGQRQIIAVHPYHRPQRAATPLVVCGNRLADAALVEVPVGKGMLYLSQLRIGTTLKSNAVAQTLLLNLLNAAQHYVLIHRPVKVVAATGSPLLEAMRKIGVAFQRRQGPLQAITPAAIQTAVIQATPENLAVLAAHRAAVRAFNQAGGWMVLNGLTPAGLASFNKLTGFHFMIRRFAVDHVRFAAARPAWAMGLSNQDLVEYSSRRIFPWQAGYYVSSHEYKYVIDYHDAAPFGTSTFGGYPLIVNGFRSDSGWPLIIDFPVKGNRIPIHFPQPVTITGWTWIGNTFYQPTTQVKLSFPGQPPLLFNTQPNNRRQRFAFPHPVTTRALTLRITRWQHNGSPGGMVGIDNIYLWIKRSAGFDRKVQPIDNVGGMMAFPRGQGGMVLFNLDFRPPGRESMPINAVKKRNLLQALLAAFHASFTGGAPVIAGDTHLRYTPVRLVGKCTQFTGTRGWFGNKRFTFADFPHGRQTLGGVPYNIYHFATSPVPTCIMLNGPGVPNHPPAQVVGIAVKRKANALFFLQAAKILRQPRPGQNVEVARYVIHYANGSSVNVPIYANHEVANYRQQHPVPLPKAQIAWQRRYSGTPFYAVAYTMEWTNPHPQDEISTIDILPGPPWSGIPVVLAITAAR